MSMSVILYMASVDLTKSDLEPSLRNRRVPLNNAASGKCQFRNVLDTVDLRRAYDALGRDRARKDRHEAARTCSLTPGRPLEASLQQLRVRFRDYIIQHKSKLKLGIHKYRSNTAYYKVILMGDYKTDQPLIYSTNGSPWI